MHSDEDSDSSASAPKTLAERIARLGLQQETGSRRASLREPIKPAALTSSRPLAQQRPLSKYTPAPSTPLPQQDEDESSDEASLSPLSVRERVQSLYLSQTASDGGNPFASPELTGADSMEPPVSPLAQRMPLPIITRRATDVTRPTVQSALQQPVLPPASPQQRPLQGARVGGRLPRPPPPPKPAGMSGPRSPMTMASAGLRSPIGTGGPLRAESLPPPPPPPAPVSTATLATASLLPPPPPPPPPPHPYPPSSSQQQSISSAPSSLSKRINLPPPPPPPVIPPPSSATGGTRTALDYSSDPALRPVPADFSASSRRPPTLSGIPPFLSMEATPASSTGPVACLGGMYAAVINQSRLVCTRIDTGEVCALHNAPGAEERFTCVATVQCVGGDPMGEGARVWVSTSANRVLVANASGSGIGVERLQTGSHGNIVCLFSAGVGEVWTIRDDGVCEAWVDRAVSRSTADSLAPVRRFSIVGEAAQLRRQPSLRTVQLLYGRELWVAGTRALVVFDTMRTGEGGAALAAHVVARSTLSSGDATLTCLASNVHYLPEAQVAARGLVVAGTDAGMLIVWRAASYARWRTVDVSNGAGDARVTAVVCASAQWLWVGFASGRLAVIDLETWAVVKSWVPPTEHGVGLLLVDWTPLLTSRAHVQCASVHTNGSVFYWDGALAQHRMRVALRRRTREFTHPGEIGVHIHTWNVGNVKPEAVGSDLVRWLGSLGSQDRPPGLVVVGLQEVVDLESKTLTAKSLWHTTTGKNRRGGGGRAAGADISKRYGRWRTALEGALQRKGAFGDTVYRAIESQHLVGLFICVLARDDLVRRITNVDVAHVKTGMGGLHGNKGAVAVRLLVDDSALCFVGAHLAAGESARNNVARQAHCAAIVQGLSFARAPTAAAEGAAATGGAYLDALADGDGTRFLDHAACFFAGDLNFRLRMPRAQADRCLELGELDPLLHHDQLLPLLAASSATYKHLPPADFDAFSDSDSDGSPGALSNSASVATGPASFALRAFREMPLSFPPTYKYDPGTDRYDTSEKRRTPAWCDRVLYRSSTRTEAQGDPHGRVTPRLYQRLEECRYSDHRPVSASFDVSTKIVDRQARERCAAEVSREYSDRSVPELIHTAKILWVARHVASFGRAAEALDQHRGDIHAAVHSLYNSSS
ncbi:hypothetical protein GGI07_001552 [Coemansia sp. Benny D115]|nr:hypothetical protein GGI07_001552 [Coemansia sp. Benny D115]